MARLGIDFGTTNTVVVVADRGSYPVVLHGIETRAGRIVEEVFPSTIWIDGERGEWVFGLEAERRARRGIFQKGAGLVASFKRELGRFTEGMQVEAAGGTRVPLEECLVRYLDALRMSVLRSGLVPDGEKLESVISWPANSSGAQRWMMRRAFARAGFEVIASINEPTASAVEYADLASGGKPETARRWRGSIAVFDIGGGTFDTSLVAIDGMEIRVIDACGIDRLGGDDFDRALLDMFLAPLGVRAEELDGCRRAALLRHARSEKEGISRGRDRDWLEYRPGDYGLAPAGSEWRSIRVPIAEYYERLRPAVSRAVGEMERILLGPPARAACISPETLDAIYLVGGSSSLPLIGRLVRQAFPSTPVVVSSRPFTSIAMGAAIFAADRVRISDVIARHFGVIRLKDEGRREYFSPIFRSGTRLPRRGEPPLSMEFAYTPRHNIGHLRYLECSKVGKNELPEGDARNWSDVLFPYDPAIPPDRPLRPTEVIETDRLSGTRVVERYWCDSDGVITVKLERRADGTNRTFEISRD